MLLISLIIALLAYVKLTSLSHMHLRKEFTDLKRSRVDRYLEKYKTRLLLLQVTPTKSYASVLQDADRPYSHAHSIGAELVIG